jgi:hypothetical protein
MSRLPYAVLQLDRHCTAIQIQSEAHGQRQANLSHPFMLTEVYKVRFITFFKRGPADPSQQCKRASNSIQDSPSRWILTIFKLKFGEGNLFSPAMTSTKEGNNFVGSLLEPLL